jgi:hypothetical protein
MLTPLTRFTLTTLVVVVVVFYSVLLSNLTFLAYVAFTSDYPGFGIVCSLLAALVLVYSLIELRDVRKTQNKTTRS